MPILDPLSPTSDLERISSHTISTIYSRHVMRIEKKINLGIIGRSNSKFSTLTSHKLYGRQSGELLILGVKGLKPRQFPLTHLITLPSLLQEQGKKNILTKKPANVWYSVAHARTGTSFIG